MGSLPLSITMFCFLFLLFPFLFSVSGNQSIEELKEIVRNELKDVMEEMEGRIDRIEAQCMNVEERANEKEKKEKEIEVTIRKMERKFEKMEEIMRIKNNINNQFEKKISDLRYRMEEYEET